MLKAAECELKASELDEVVTWLTTTTPEEVNNLWAIAFCDEAKTMRQKAVTLVYMSFYTPITIN